jgi:hydrogenase maturation protease
VAGNHSRDRRRILALSRTALVIGYGNPLRGDDGIGPAVARAFENAGGGRQTRAIVCHQLTPELAECIAAVDLAVFVDAAVNVGPGTVAMREIRGASPPASGLGHIASPVALLDLASRLCGRSPVAFLVTVGVSSLALSEVLSDTAAAALPVAIAAVRQLISERLAAD